MRSRIHLGKTELRGGMIECQLTIPQRTSLPRPIGRSHRRVRTALRSRLAAHRAEPIKVPARGRQRR